MSALTKKNRIILKCLVYVVLQNDTEHIWTEYVSKDEFLEKIDGKRTLYLT